MPVLRTVTALLLAAVTAAAGSRAAPSHATPDDVCGVAVAGIDRLDAPPSSPRALLAEAPAAPIVASESTGRTTGPAPRSLRTPATTPPAPRIHARVAALIVSRLAFAHDLDAARIGWFSFGSTAPPPFHG